MPVSFSGDCVMIAVDANKKAESMLDVLTADTPRGWRGKKLRFKLAFFYGEELIDLSDISSISIAIKDAADRLGLVLAGKTVASPFNNALTLEQWEERSAQHLIVTFTGAEMKLAMDGQTEKNFWLVISGIGTDLEPIAFGGTTFTLQEDGTSEDDANVPPLGASIIPLGAVYDGSGHYVLAVTANKLHSYTKGANDTSISNGTETVAASGAFAAQGATITLNGTAGALITAVIRWPLVLTADQSDARYLNGVAKLMNDPGVPIGTQSSNSRFIRLWGVDDDGNRTDQVIDTTA